MSKLSHKDFPWKRSRSGFAVFFFFWLLIAFTFLRMVLLWKFGWNEKIGLLAGGQLLFIGFIQDFLVGLIMTVPLLIWLWIVPDRIFEQAWHRVLFILGFFIFWTAQVFVLFTEFYFFEEFKSRFNTVAVDYLLYPKEVAGNIWDSYPVGIILTVCTVVSLAWVIMAFWYFHQMWHQPTSTRLRFVHLAVVIVLAGLLAKFMSLEGMRFSENRTLNEISNSGTISFVAAFWTRNLDYHAFYKTINPEEAYQRVRRLVAEPHSEFVENGQSIRRRVAGDPSLPKLNVVILLEESLGSEFWGCLGRKETLTPEMDKLALQEGILFTNLYASGNRTVRGFEGVLSSFPPLPGDSIVKRDRSENVETIARVLKRDGYSTVFLYGGRGLFDGMRSFTTANGYDRFIEQKDFPDPKFSTIWGVCDEEVFARAIDEFRALAKTGKPFLGTILSVSNHKPFTYPPGRIPEDPNRKKRAHAVKYSDWCLGDFFKRAKQEPFWTNTVFVVVADHGARVYGSQSIPIRSYEIPLVVLGPAVVKSPARAGQLGCSLDVGPTVLGLIGRPYESMFFGRDLLKMKPQDGRVFINHNRDIGMMERERMVVLGLMHTSEFYEGDPKLVNIPLMSSITDVEREIEKDAIAAYQVADDLYMHNRFRLEGAPPLRPSTATNTATGTNNAEPAPGAPGITNTATGTNVVDAPNSAAPANAAAPENP